MNANMDKMLRTCGIIFACVLALAFAWPHSSTADQPRAIAPAPLEPLERAQDPARPNVWVVNKVSLERGLLVKRNGDGTAEVIVGHQFPPPPTRRVEKWYDNEFVVEAAR